MLKLQMVPPVSHDLDPHEVKELNAISCDAACDALFIGSATSRFRGYVVHAHSWLSPEGVRLRIVLCNAQEQPLMAQEQIHRRLAAFEREVSLTEESSASAASRRRR